MLRPLAVRGVGHDIPCRARDETSSRALLFYVVIRVSNPDCLAKCFSATAAFTTIGGAFTSRCARLDFRLERKFEIEFGRTPYDQRRRQRGGEHNKYPAGVFALFGFLLGDFLLGDFSHIPSPFTFCIHLIASHGRSRPFEEQHRAPVKVPRPETAKEANRKPDRPRQKRPLDQQTGLIAAAIVIKGARLKRAHARPAETGPTGSGIGE